MDERPGIRLTVPQVCRLWSLTRPEADVIIRALVERGVLAVDDAGRVRRPHDLDD